ncbi:anti-sigma factor [Niallia sp. NCCP-28]|uniref:anti-sigma factor family protein n=1 Tax=Niallia sp. NCCP-28 TaxID=2934712 RepID=UPI002084E435|nr:zf-HC2 domain-containing protein [Niallia sp. NCCP-28]GKU84495.1 hypothetical protein NCCP28_38910 [Niallia sp. NCCP-28]
MTTHYTYDQWLKYVNDELDEDTRILLENHLYSCDECLDLYVGAVAEQETVLPAISNETNFTDQIMMKIASADEEEKEGKQQKKKRSIYQSSFFHYTLAAAATIFLMSTGVFQTIIQHTQTIQRAEVSANKESEMTRFVDKTFSWIDTLESNKKEEKKK